MDHPYLGGEEKFLKIFPPIDLSARVGASRVRIPGDAQFFSEREKRNGGMENMKWE